MMEFSIPVAGDVAVLKELPSNVAVGLGCVDVRFPEVEPPERIAERVEKALAHIAAERIWLNPDCGFAPGKDHEIPLEEAYAKLKNLGQAGRLLRSATLQHFDLALNDEDFLLAQLAFEFFLEVHQEAAGRMLFDSQNAIDNDVIMKDDIADLPGAGIAWRVSVRPPK